MIDIDVNKVLTGARYAVTYVGGLVTALGLSSTVDPNALQSGFDHVFNGIKEIAVGVGILAPVAATAWGVFEQTVGRLVAKVHAVSPGDLLRAVSKNSPGTLIQATANLAPGNLLNAVSRNSPATLAMATAALTGVQVTVSGAAPVALRTLAADDSYPDIVRASSTAPPVSPPVARAQKE